MFICKSLAGKVVFVVHAPLGVSNNSSLSLFLGRHSLSTTEMKKDGTIITLQHMAFLYSNNFKFERSTYTHTMWKKINKKTKNKK